MSRKVSGLRAWVFQRITAVYLALFFFAATFYFLGAGGAPFGSLQGYLTWRGLLQNPAVSIATALFFLALLLHAWVGVRDIVMDYFGSATLRFTALVALGVTLWVAGLSVLRSLFVVVLS